MTIGQAVAQRIEQLCRERGLTINKLGTICGVTQSTLNNIINHHAQQPNPRIATIKKLCDGLEISLVEFFDAQVFADLEQELK